MTDKPTNEDFLRLADPMRRELLAHCYRMMGSVHDAEDQVQETYLRAWRAYDGFEGRSSLRTWLYRIATTTCLTALDNRSRRPLPTGLGAPSTEASAPLAQDGEVPWLEPAPDAMTGVGADDPAAVVTSRESVRLALIAALQHLPPRQRAVLVLRDVLRWKAAEVAEAVGISTAAVNSILQRARAQLNEVSPHLDDPVEPLTTEQQAHLERYVAAFENYDVDGLVHLFTEDAIWEMPPFVGWYQGPEAIAELTRIHCPAQGPGDLKLVPIAANGQPAFAVYHRADGVYGQFAIMVVTFSGDRVGHVGMFFEESLFETFGMPAKWEGSETK
ncbi:sigma-70 family RNA polymerase sigma factor [Nonomuraea fuscirosea]|jgi:RNA polymerase sigma-70 factor, ECF subfamily|uniref:sigma-70 family RNA polymerase sigma factor n=1 Tax=Nonomuraea fuscirosea TaxID=1291556 RepID=UPI002DDA1036|nr:sigma-70 family RNA polymerase sigma factor [Nonomuraea fuscirosea]WSA53162.1 sigma-70 family RNA polymerase sigma factor [Nonomuraea fuscirosea]